MAKKVMQPQDKYVLRLPDGLRDRIKAYAEKKGRSMNAEIVRILEREFPEPWPIEKRLTDLLDMVKILKAGVADPAVDQLGMGLLETVEGIASGRVTGLDEETRAAVRERLNDWISDDAEDSTDEYVASLDDEERAMLDKTGGTEKF